MPEVTPAQPLRESFSLWDVITRNVWLLMAVGVILFLILLLSEAHYELRENPFIHAGEAFALSLVEAGLLMLLIEKRASREQVTRSLALIEQATKATTAQVEKSTGETARLIEISTAKTAELTQNAIDSLFDAVYKKHVPPEIVRLYEYTAFRSAFFRRRHEYICTFANIPGDPTAALILATFYQSFEMENLTGAEQTFTLACESQLPSNPAHLQHCKFEQLLVAGDDVLSLAKVEIVQRVGYEAHLLSYAVRIPPRQSRYFQTSFRTVRHRRDFEVVVCNWPSDGILLHVNNLVPGLDVSLNALHYLPLESVSTSEASKIGTLRAGFLPGQGVCLTWETK